MADNDDPLAKFRGVLPSRAKLAQLSLFGTTEEARSSAQALLDILPEMTVNERSEYMNETWRLANTLSEADMEKSPAGRATLELIRNSKPLTSGNTEGRTMDDSAPESPATNAQAAIPERLARPGPEVDDVNPHLRRLAWPPKTSAPPKAPEDDGIKHKWVSGLPSPQSKDQQPVSDWNSDSSNSPIY